MELLPTDLDNEYHDLDHLEEPRGEYQHATGELLETLKEWRIKRRMGMTEADHFGTVFVRTPPRHWSKKELRNRIAWLRGERGKILGGALPVNSASGRHFANKNEALQVTDRKLAKYKRELFRRESARNQKAEREEFNAKRRRKRAEAKRKVQKTLVDAWLARRQESRKSLKRKGNIPIYGKEEMVKAIG